MSPTEPTPPAHNALAVPVLLCVVFLSIIGFGIVIPLLPFYGAVFQAPAWQVTLMFAVFAAGQFIGELLWGRLSDRFGRKPVILVTILFSAAGYVALALAPNIWLAIAARAVAGVFSGNLSTIQAYIVDVTPKERLGARLGLIGSAFSVGFVVGPTVGGLLSRADIGAAGFRPPLFAAAAVGALAAVAALFFVRESLGPTRRDARRGPGPIQALRQAWRNPVLRRVMGSTFLSFAGFSAVWSSLGLWGAERFGWGPKAIGGVLAITGLAAAASQGLFSGWPSRRIGEASTVAVGLLLAAAFLVAESASPWPALAVALMTVAVAGHAITQPASSALVSRAASSEEQGAALGANNAASAAARVVGPLAAGVVFSALGSWAPFILAAVVLTPAALLAWRVGRLLKAAP